MAVRRKSSDSNEDMMPLHLLSSMFTEYYLKGWNIVSSSTSASSLHVDFQFQSLKSSQFNVGPSAAFCVQILQKLYTHLRVKRWTVVSNNRETGLIHISFTFEFRSRLRRVPSDALPSINHRLTKESGSMSNVNSLVQLFEELKMFEEHAAAGSQQHSRKSSPSRFFYNQDSLREDEEDEYEVPRTSKISNRISTPAPRRKGGNIPNSNNSREAIFNEAFTSSKFLVAEPKSRDESPAYTVVFPAPKPDKYHEDIRRFDESNRLNRHHSKNRNLNDSHGLNRSELSAREKVLRMLESSDQEQEPSRAQSAPKMNGDAGFGGRNGKDRTSYSQQKSRKHSSAYSNGPINELFMPASSDSPSNHSMSVSTDNTDLKSGKPAVSARVQSSNEAVELVCAMCKRSKSERFHFKPCQNCYQLYCSDCFWWCVVEKKKRCVQCYYESEPITTKDASPASSTGTPQEVSSRKSSKSKSELIGRTYKPINPDSTNVDLLPNNFAKN